MRSTVLFDPNLLAESTKRAAEADTTLTAVVERELREPLVRRDIKASAQPLRPKIFKGSRLCVGVDLDDSAALLDLKERWRAAGRPEGAGTYLQRRRTSPRHLPRRARSPDQRSRELRLLRTGAERLLASRHAPEGVRAAQRIDFLL